MLSLVLLGVGVSGGLFHWLWRTRVQGIVSDRRREIEAAPRTPEGRLSRWLEFGNAQIHHRLTLLRFSPERPWLVTGAVGSDPADLEIHGIDLAQLPRDLGRIEGLSVRLRLPEPGLLGRGALTGANAGRVPVVAAAAAAPDREARALELVRFALGDLTRALERDIPGARLVIEVGPGAGWGTSP